MAIWNPWRGCHRHSEGCKFCYIHKGDTKRGVDTNAIVKAETVPKIIEKYKRGDKKGQYKITAGETIYLCFSSDFLIEEADQWREECWQIINERKDLNFIFLTKRIERFMDCIPDNWGEGYDNVVVGCSVENQDRADYRLSILKDLPIKHKNIICQPLIGAIDLERYLDGIELVVVGGESDYNARPLNYDWVLAIREQCIKNNVKFEFRQCGSNFIKDGKLYKINVRQLCSQARRAGINT